MWKYLLAATEDTEQSMKEKDFSDSPSGKEKCFPLSSIEKGNKVTLVAVEGGRGIRSRLASMGMLPGAKIEVIKKNNGGPLVVTVKESRVMLGRGMAHKIIVK
jgi:ferrous iron transport protein A